MKYSYYLIENDYGKAYVRTNAYRAIIVKFMTNNTIGIEQFDTGFKKQQGDVVNEITRELFINKLNEAICSISKVA